MPQQGKQEDEKRHSLLAISLPAKILLVEDNLVNQKIAAALLRKAGLQVTVANNGLEAVQILADETFNLVLMDIQMQVMNGIAACRKIRESLPALPIIAMTAESADYDLEQCFAAGMNDYIKKPIDIADLYEKIYRWLVLVNLDEKNR